MTLSGIFNSRDLEIIPDSWPEQDFDPVYDLTEHYARFVLKFRNLVDLATILPYYLGMMMKHATPGASYLRAFRLLRIIKLFQNLQRLQITNDLVLAALRRSAIGIGVSIMIIITGTIFFAMITYEAEKGTFQASVKYPHGVYLRNTYNGVGLEISPFLSIPTTFYFILLSLTVTGDDMAPTSDAGRCLASLVMLFGIVAVTIPFVVVAVNFEEAFQQEKDRQWSAASMALHIKNMDAEDFEYLFDVLDRNGNGSLDVQELSDALTEIGVHVSVGWLMFMMQGEDANNDGVISKDEFVGICFVLQGRKAEHAEHQRLLKERFIKSQLKQVSEEELAADDRRKLVRQKSERFTSSVQKWGGALTAVGISSMTEEDMCILFDITDADDSGGLSEDEVLALLSRMGVPVLEKEDLVTMIQEDDCDGDGVISREEFIGICYKIQGRVEDYEEQRRKLKTKHIATSLHISTQVCPRSNRYYPCQLFSATEIPKNSN